MRNYQHDIVMLFAERLTGFAKNPNDAAQEILDAFADFRPPTRRTVSRDTEFFDYVSINNLNSQAESYKPGNITLSWRRLAEKFPEIFLIANGFTGPFSGIASALHVWTILKGLAKIEISPAHASILYAMAAQCPFKCEYLEQELVQITNKVRQQHLLPHLQALEVATLLNDLHSFKCIRIEEGRIFLIEEVRIPIAA